MATRRSFLVGAAAAGVAAAGAGSWAGFRAFTEITPNVRMPGQAAGHRLRDLHALPTPSETRRVGVAICGSGIGGLSCAWRLAKSGRRDAVVVEGPERYGNAAGGAFGTQRFPTGAHYLPLPSMESTHVREMLADFGVIERDPFALRPTYDERVLVHAPDERLWLGNRWQDGFVPREGITEAERAEHTRFFAHIDRLRQTIGADGRRVFVVPTALSSADPAWRAFDALTFRDWLHREGYRAATLHWYADYCCRDDYGVTADHVSAWAGIAYFASRGGMASNAEQGTVLTWPEGLDWMAERLFEAAGLNEPGRLLPGSVARIGTRTEAGARVFADVLQADGRVVRLLADHVVSAMPLHVAKHIIDGFDVPAAELPETAPWLLANLLIDGFPPEHDDTPLAWDNVVYRGTGLGYVVANHQDIRVGPPAQSVFTAYVALSDMTPKAAREWLLKASPQALLDRALADLDTVYGIRLRTQIRRADLTLRGHAMAIPTPGFLSRPGIARLRESAGPIHYAHADLSGYSVFEEAAWWGIARRGAFWAADCGAAAGLLRQPLDLGHQFPRGRIDIATLKCQRHVCADHVDKPARKCGRICAARVLHQLLPQETWPMLPELAHVGLRSAEEGSCFQRTIKVDAAFGECHWRLPNRNGTRHSQGGEGKDAGRRPLNTTVMEPPTDCKRPD